MIIKKAKMPKTWTDKNSKAYNNRWYKWFYSLPQDQRTVVIKN